MSKSSFAFPVALAGLLTLAGAATIQSDAGNLAQVFVSITTLALFMMHGAIFLTMKTENRLFVKLHVLSNNFIVFFVISFVITTLYALLYIPHLSDFFKSHPAYFTIPLLMVVENFSSTGVPTA